MLCLSRRQDERIIIDERITITVIRIGFGQVRLGFECDRDVPIRREELPPKPRGDALCKEN